jgi:hypothetical protein
MLHCCTLLLPAVEYSTVTYPVAQPRRETHCDAALAHERQWIVMETIMAVLVMVMVAGPALPALLL